MGIILGALMLCLCPLIAVGFALFVINRHRRRGQQPQAVAKQALSAAPPVNTAGQGGAKAAAPAMEPNEHAALPESPESPEDKEERIQEEEQNKEEEQLPVLGFMDRIDDWLDSW